MLIDTSLFIEHLRSRDKASTTLYKLPKKQICYISSVTIFELFMGATDKQKHEAVHNLINLVVRLDFDEVVAKKASAIYLELKRSGRMIDFRDIFIAATALVHDLPIATLKKKYFSRISNLALV